MVLDAVANFVRGNTDAAVDATQTTISVVDASIFPDPATQGEYNVVIWDAQQFPRPDQDADVEVLRVTAIDTGTNDLTVVRGQEGTAGASHPSGSAVHLSPTAKMFGDIESTFGDFWDATNQELTADVNNPLTTTDNADIAGNLTYIEGDRQNNVIDATAGTFVNLIDTEIADTLGELDANFHINPQNTQKYRLEVAASVNAGADQDRIQIVLVDAADDSIIETLAKTASSGAGGGRGISTVRTRTLSSTTEYYLAVQDRDSTFSVESAGTRALVTKAVVHD